MRMKKKFLRRDWNKIIRFGRRKKLKWRRQMGRHSKIRQAWKGYSKMPQVGYKAPRKTRCFVEGKKSVMINNISDLSNIKANEIGIVSSTIGKKMKIDLAKKALELKVHLANLDSQKFLSEIQREQEEKKKAGKKEAKKEVKEKEEKKETKEEKSEKKVESEEKKA